MKRVLATFALLLSLTVAFAKSYSVSDVPNVFTKDSTQYVSNPDGIISPEATAAINRAMAQIHALTTVEPAVVVLSDIDDDPDDFATDLFEEWGLGKKDKDNGLLVLVVTDLHRAVIRPGYGLEGVLPDILCANILKEKFVPEARQGNYSAGLVATASTLEQVLTNPEVREEIMSRLRNNADDEDIDFFTAYFIVACIIAVALLIILIIQIVQLKGKNHHDKYIALNKLIALYLALTFLGIGIPLIASLPLMIILRRLRSMPHKCPNCGSKMYKVDEVHDNEFLSSSQDFEERLGSVDYDVWRCPSCGETDIEQYVETGSGFTECSYCHTHACHFTRDRIIQPPTTLRAGKGVKEYTCAHCGFVNMVPYIIPALPPVIISGGSGRGGSGFGGGGFSGGSFGGGHTGGGGASVGW